MRGCAAVVAVLLGLSCGDKTPPQPPVLPDGGLLPSSGQPSSVSDAARRRAQVQKHFAQAYHLDTVRGQIAKAEVLYRKVTKEGQLKDREVALSHLRLATLCRARAERRCAMTELDWLINHARLHPALARRAEREMVDLLHPQAGRVSALTRGPPVSFTRLQQVPPDVALEFRDAEKALLRYVRVPLALQLHNVDAVLNRKRVMFLNAIHAYERLVKSPLPNVQAAALFRQGSLHQDLAEALGRARLPSELLSKVAGRIRARLHAESVVHFKAALELYRKASGIRDVIAERWRQAAAQAEARLGRMAWRR